MLGSSEGANFGEYDLLASAAGVTSINIVVTDSGGLTALASVLVNVASAAPDAHVDGAIDIDDNGPLDAKPPDSSGL